MSSRTIWFMFAAMAMFGLYGLDGFYRSWIERPSQQLNSELGDLNDKLSASKEEQRVALKQGKQLEALSARALPDDPQLGCGAV